MKKKILVWPRSSIIFFCIVKFLRDQLDSELYFIIDDNHVSKKFYSEQKFVPIKNLLYFNDYIFQDLKNPDMEYLKKFEERSKLSLWKIAFTDRYFYNYNRYYKFKSNEILSLLEYSCRFFERNIEKINPDVLITNVSSFPQDLILHNICRRKGIKVLALFSPRIGNTNMIANECDVLEEFEIDENLKKKSRSYEEIKNSLTNYSKMQKDFAGIRSSAQKYVIKAGIKFLFKNDKNYEKYYTNYGRTKLNLIKNELSIMFKRIRITKYLEKYRKEINENERIIYFPLHFEPERSTLISAPFFVNQLEVITNIAKSLPIGFKLIVKEHPLMKSIGWRDISFYKKIEKLPNVEMVHPKINNQKLIDLSKLVITINGTSGLEAAFSKKPSITLAETIYNTLPSVLVVKSFDKLSESIKIGLNTSVNELDLKNYLDLIETNSFKPSTFKLSEKVKSLFFYKGFTSNPIFSMNKMELFLSENKDELSAVAREFIKKIE